MGKKRIVFVGSGMMAEAMIAGLIKKKLANPEDITGTGPREERGAELRKKYGVKASVDNNSTIHEADVVVLSVKPQRLTEVMKGLKGVRSDALVLSVIAGASMKKLSAGLKHKAIVRSMPNTPGQIGEAAGGTAEPDGELGQRCFLPDPVDEAAQQAAARARGAPRPPAIGLWLRRLGRRVEQE